MSFFWIKKRGTRVKIEGLFVLGIPLKIFFIINYLS